MTIGIIFGKFYPLHTGHIYLVQRSLGQVDELHLVLGYNCLRDNHLFKKSFMSKKPSEKDRLRWLLQTFKYQKNIIIHLFNENNIKSYPYGWKEWSKRIKKFMFFKNIKPTFVFTSEKQDIKKYLKYLNIKSILIDPKRSFVNISSTKIRNNPFLYWNYIPKEVQPFFVKKVVIIGGESSGKSVLTNKLATVFNTNSTYEFGRNYIFTHLGGKEQALQYSDYYQIALGQAHIINQAIKQSNKIIFIDTDFVTIQAFCKKYEKKEHPFVQALIELHKFDLVILLENNTPWIDDGLRSLGTKQDRNKFQKLIIKLLNKNKINFFHIKNKNYDNRFLECLNLISTFFYRKR